MFKALQGVYKSVQACVREKCAYSGYFDCPKGVKQGCLLSPLMFSFFINELAVELSKKGKHGIQLVPGAIELFLMLFADDVVLLSNTVTGLQNQLTNLKKEADRLSLTVNLDKTNIMVFRKGGHLSANEKWIYGKEELKVTNSYTYLGMMFTTKLSISGVLNELSTKGKRGVMAIQKTMRKLNTADPCLFWKMFDTQIEPILTYAAEVWGLDEAQSIEKVHTFAIKRFLNVPLHSSNKMVYGETGRYPLFIRTTVKCIKYWIKLTRLPMTRLSRQAYKMLLAQSEAGRENWTTKVKKVLVENGFGFVWLSQGVGMERHFLRQFKDRLICCYKQNWHSEIEENVKYKWFYSFKCAFQAEKYLCITDRWRRDNFARFRLRTCGLYSNKQWFVIDEQVQNCLCPLCTEEPEDEVHFLFKCKCYASLRQKFAILECASSQPDMNTVFRLLASSDLRVMRSLACFIAMALDIRKKKMEERECTL